MYSTSIKDDRSFAKCLLVFPKKSVIYENFVVDTGSRYTCCHYTVVDKALKEDWLCSSEIKLIGGIIKGDYLKLYKYHLKQFTIGNIDLGAQDIWITFDERITDIILGMDILKQLIFISDPCDQRICFCKDRDDYHRNFRMAVN